MEPERVKISVAAKMLNVAPLTIRRGIYAGRIPFIKTDTKRLFIPMSWIRQQMGDSPTISNLKDFISIVNSYCIKTYGDILGQKKADKIIGLLDN